MLNTTNTYNTVVGKDVVTDNSENTPLAMQLRDVYTFNHTYSNTTNKFSCKYLINIDLCIYILSVNSELYAYLFTRLCD